MNSKPSKGDCAFRMHYTALPFNFSIPTEMEEFVSVYIYIYIYNYLFTFLTVKQSSTFFFLLFFSPDEFKLIISKTSLHQQIPFPLDSDFIKLYFGKDKQRCITYAEFSQFLHDFHDEYAMVGFRAKDKDHQGYISANDFYDIMVSIKSHLLTEPVQHNLISAAQGQQVSYAYFVAFISLLSNIELIKKIYLNATNGSRTQEVTKGMAPNVHGLYPQQCTSFLFSEEFLHSAQMMSQITPLEVDVLYQLCDLLHQSG